MITLWFGHATSVGGQCRGYSPPPGEFSQSAGARWGLCRTNRRSGRRRRRCPPRPSATTARRAAEDGAPSGFPYQNAPWRSRRTPARSPASTARAALRFSSGSTPARARSSRTQPMPPAPLSSPTCTADAASAGASRQAWPVPHVPEPHGGAPCGLQVAGVAGRAARVKVHPGDACGTELEARHARRVVARKRPAQSARTVGDRLAVRPRQETACRGEVAGIAVVPVPLEEHVRRPGGPGKESGLGGVVLGSSRQRAHAVSGQAAKVGGTGARVGAERRIAGTLGEGVECEDDAGLAHADAVVCDAPGGVVGPSPRPGGLRAGRAFGTRDHPAHALQRRRAEALLVRDLEQLPEVVADPRGSVVEAREVRRRATPAGIRPVGPPQTAAAGSATPSR